MTDFYQFCCCCSSRFDWHLWCSSIKPIVPLMAHCCDLHIEHISIFISWQRWAYMYIHSCKALLSCTVGLTSPFQRGREEISALDYIRFSGYGVLPATARCSTSRTSLSITTFPHVLLKSIKPKATRRWCSRCQPWPSADHKVLNQHQNHLTISNVWALLRREDQLDWHLQFLAV